MDAPQEVWLVLLSMQHDPQFGERLFQILSTDRFEAGADPVHGRTTK
jgi:hypothetical protein